MASNPPADSSTPAPLPTLSFHKEQGIGAENGTGASDQSPFSPRTLLARLAGLESWSNLDHNQRGGARRRPSTAPLASSASLPTLPTGMKDLDREQPMSASRRILKLPAKLLSWLAEVDHEEDAVYQAEWRYRSLFALKKSDTRPSSVPVQAHGSGAEDGPTRFSIISNPLVVHGLVKSTSVPFLPGAVSSPSLLSPKRPDPAAVYSPSTATRPSTASSSSSQTSTQSYNSYSSSSTAASAQSHHQLLSAASSRAVTPRITKGPGSGRDKYPAKFIKWTSIFQAFLVIATLWWNSGIESMWVNPLVGPSVDTLIAFGAKDGDLIRNEGEWWRLFSAMMLHVGVLHYLGNLMFQVSVGRQLEHLFGTWRVATVYVFSGLGGNLLSMVMLPNQVQVGASGALYGLLGVAVYDLMQNWRYTMRPKRTMAGLVLTLAMSLGIGLMPSVDNFAHIGGLLTGFIVAAIVIPTVNLGKWRVRTKLLLVAVSIPILLIWLGLLALWMYTLPSGGATWCRWCVWVNCFEPEGALWDCEEIHLT